MTQAPRTATVLGFDYGKARIGVAIGSTETNLAEPLATILNSPDHLSRITELIARFQPNRLIVGVSENTSAHQAHEFADRLRAKFQLAVDLVDETLSSQDALRHLHHLRPRKRAQMQHAAAAAVMLGHWLDEQAKNAL